MGSITSNMKAFAILALLLPLAAAIPARQERQSGYGYAPAPYHPAPAYGHGHGYGYEQPKHNCSVLDVVEPAEVCTPVIVTECNAVELPIKIIVEVDFTYTVVRTVCTESIEVVPQEVCSYSYTTTEEETTAKTVEVTLKRKKMSKWSLSANPDTRDMVDTDMDMVVMDTTTARKLPKQLPTMCPLSLPSMSPSLLPTLPLLRPVLTNPLTCQLFLVLT